MPDAEGRPKLPTSAGGPQSPLPAPPHVPAPYGGPGRKRNTTDSQRQPPRRRRLLRITAAIGAVFALLLVAAGAGAVFLFFRLSSNVPVDHDVRTVGKPGADEPINILLMGSDKRTGKGNRGYGTDAGRSGERSDTTILLHVSADREHATAVSIPRDTWEKQPRCAAETAGQFAKFNNAFQYGGAACTTRLVSRMTGVGVNHVVVVDFGGFKEMIDALGGVEVCLNAPIYDESAKLDLPAGKSVVDGEQALGFVRARKSVGDGSDIGRIARQQEFLSAAIRQVTSSGLLLNPVRLYQVLDIATQSVTVDKDLQDLSALRNLVESLRDVGPDQITFVTMPHYWVDSANVAMDEERAQPIWDSMIKDRPWPPPVSRSPDGRRLTVAPEQVSVHVINASGEDGLGARASRLLSKEGFRVTAISDRGGKVRKTRVLHPTGLKHSAQTLGYAAGVSPELDHNVYAPTLVLGKDWDGVTDEQIIVAQPRTDADPNKSARTAEESVCS